MSDVSVTPRLPDCSHVTGVAVGFSRNIASCKKDCDKGFGFRCGGYNYVCANGELTHIVAVDDKCPENLINDPHSYEWTPVDTIVTVDSSRVVEMLLRILDRYTARIDFLSPLPAEDLNEYPYFEVESNTVRLEHSGYTFGTSTVYRYFQFVEGDYPIITGTTSYGYTIIDITSY